MGNKLEYNAKYLAFLFLLTDMGTTSLDLPQEELKKHFEQLKTRQDVARLLQVSDYQLRYHLYIHPRDKAYTTFKIPKKSGGHRLITTPQTSLKIIQHKLNQVLSSVYQVKPSVHGFAIQKSIVTNAKIHLKQRYILNLEDQDFFPSINFGRVRGLFIAKPYNCTQEVATILAQICCYNNQLPQGAPTSPIISNMICARLDSQLQKLAKKYRCIYTRYADDITFSTSRFKFPHRLAYFSQDSETFVLADELITVIKDNGFSVNLSKLRLQNRYQRQEVTGIIVNEKLNVKRKYIRQVRAILHAWKKYGLENAEAEFYKGFNENNNNMKSRDCFRKMVQGKINFIGLVRGDTDHIYLKFLKQLKVLVPDLADDSKINFITSKLSEIKSSNNLHKAIIWTEGKTDIKHLKVAWKWLINKKIVDYFDLDYKDDLEPDKQGSSQLFDVCKQFCKEKRNIPLIAIFDRDEPNIIKKIHDDSQGFKDWDNGVYSFALPIPKHRQDVKEICIEHYYQDSEIKRTDKKNKRLFLSNEFHRESGRHLSKPQLTTTDNKFKSNQLKIIDGKVFDSDNNNVALPKDDFATYIYDKEEGFNDFDFTAFKEVFEIIEKILNRHYSQ
ncbi:probable RNA-directed DNA polymerase [Crocosphaera subtropica ATCC 51142]|uniref:RNA-directed DNA polymerase n=2 Tax=Crocosphaera TaxID=263510 RepID=B1WTX0_CROS5|nr:probable RNA-directed DNA polymerase [Crocosphaera subtropica ATCC 51142]